jgi:DNA gyrase subunit B/topoisomerase-4 subunit B
MTYRYKSVQLSDCEQHGLGTELFIVEGDSAAKSVCQVVDRAVQAVLPMQGKPRNSLKASRKSMEGHDMFQKLIAATGCGWDSKIDLDAMRYERILLLFDPDADGIHCGTLMLFFFYRWMRPLLDEGRIKVIRPPIMQIEARGFDEPAVSFSAEHLAEQTRLWHDKGITDVKKRPYRGLASIPAFLLSRHCVDPRTRVEFSLSAQDAESAIEIFGGLGPA